MDLNVENYSIIELMIVLGLSEDPTHDEVKEKSQEMIQKFTDENKLVLADFFTKARDRVIDYLDTMDNFEEDYHVLLEEINNANCDLRKSSLYESVDADKNIIKGDECAVDINPQYTNVMTRMVVINSEFIKKNSSGDFTFDLSEPVTDLLSVSLYSFHIPYTWYNITESTNYFVIKVSGVDETISIVPGNYSRSTLIAALSAALSGKNIIVDFNSQTGKVTFTLPNTVSSVVFYDKSATSSKQNNHLGYILGFRENEILQDSTTSSSTWSTAGTCVCHIPGTKYLQLMMDDFNKHRLNTNIVNIVNNKDESLKTPVNFNFTIERNHLDQVIETNPRTLTRNQIYAMNQIDEDRSQNSIQPNKTTPPGTSDMFAILPTEHHKMELGDMCTNANPSLQMNKRSYFGPVTLSRMHVKLLDDKGNVVDLNGGDWSFTLLCETIYQGTQKTSHTRVTNPTIL